eukprot:1160391-Pelagomonas_calceolata.AAC.6
MSMLRAHGPISTHSLVLARRFEHVPRPEPRALIHTTLMRASAFTAPLLCALTVGHVPSLHLLSHAPLRLNRGTKATAHGSGQPIFLWVATHDKQAAYPCTTWRASSISLHYVASKQHIPALRDEQAAYPCTT